MATLGIILIATALLATLAIVATARRHPERRPLNVDHAGPDEHTFDRPVSLAERTGRFTRENAPRDVPAQRW